MKELYEQLGISSKVYDFGAEIEAAVKRCVYANAEEGYLLADHTKFGKKISSKIMMSVSTS